MKNTSGDMDFSNMWKNFEGVEQKQNWPQNGANEFNRKTQKTYPGECKSKQLRRSRQA